jgi:hypothetical protein
MGVSARKPTRHATQRSARAAEEFLAQIMLYPETVSASAKTDSVRMVAAPGVRRSLTQPGDIRSDIDFQNDVNRLLARMEEARMPWKPAAELCTYAVGPLPDGYRRRNSVKIPLRVFDGGRASGAPDAPAKVSAPERPSARDYAATAPTTAVPSFSRR